MRFVNAVPPPFLRTRRVLRSAILPLALASLIASSVSAGTNGWTAIGPPFEVQSMAVDPHDSRILFAAGFDKMARSDDRGATWTVMPVSFSQPSAVRVAFSLPSTVYVLGFGGLYRSVTGGTTWVERTVPLPGFAQDLQVDARDSQTIVLTALNFCFLGCAGGGVYRSTNGGGSWSSIGFKNVNVYHLALDPTSSSIIYISYGSTLLRTGNGGSSWLDISPPSGEIWQIAVDPVVPSNVYVATDGGVFRTPDSGHSWELLRPSQYSSFIAIEPGNSRWVFAAADGAFLSTDSGKSWQELSVTGPGGFFFNSRGQLVVTRDAIYSIANIPGAAGQILVYDLKQVHRRAAGR
jgi:photosystem II stability/assembly factor-like uncharacterized protein